MSSDNWRDSSLLSAPTGVYIWGRGRAAASCPALSSSPAFAAVESSPSEPDPPVKAPTRMFSLLNTNIIQVSCGGTHNVVLSALKRTVIASVGAGGDFTIALSDGGQIYSWGSNLHGQLGLGDEDCGIVPAPSQLLSLHKISITQVSAGGCHCLALSSDGRVYSWGHNGSGRLGHGHKRNVFRPKSIATLRNMHVIQIACGWSHSMCIVDGAVYTWGKGCDGRLGHANTEDKLVPTKVVAGLSNQHIAVISGGYFHSCALTVNRDLYSWGWGQHGQLGHGVVRDELTPRRIEKLTGKQIHSVSCGGFHTIAVTENGSIYSWGLGEHGQLGTGGDYTVLVPQKVRTVQNVVNAACGWWQSLCTCQLSEEERFLSAEDSKKATSNSGGAKKAPLSSSISSAKGGFDWDARRESVYLQKGVQLTVQHELTKLRRSLITSKCFGSQGAIRSELQQHIALERPASDPNPAVSRRKTGTYQQADSPLASTNSLSSQIHPPPRPQRYDVPDVSTSASLYKPTKPVSEDRALASSQLLPTTVKVAKSDRLCHSDGAIHPQALVTVFHDYPDLSSCDTITIEARSCVGGEHPKAVASHSGRSRVLYVAAPKTEAIEAKQVTVTPNNAFEETLKTGTSFIARVFNGRLFEQLKLEREEKDAISLYRQWEREVLPQWSKCPTEIALRKRAQKLAMTGIPVKLRGQVWLLAIGNKLNLGKSDFEELCRAPVEGVHRRESTMQLIKVDLPRTFPELRLFHRGGPCHQSELTTPQALCEILMAWQALRPDIGYVQGMSFLAATLLIYTDPISAFICFANILHSHFFESLYMMNLKKIFAHIKLYDLLFSLHMPLLYGHFEKLGVSAEHYLMDWFFTIFTKSLPLELVGRVWDRFLFQGEVSLFITALALLKMHKKILMKSTFEECVLTLRHLPRMEDEEASLLDIADSIEVPPYVQSFVDRLVRGYVANRRLSTMVDASDITSFSVSK